MSAITHRPTDRDRQSPSPAATGVITHLPTDRDRQSPSPAATGVTTHFDLAVADAPDVLARVVGLCARRGGEITSLDYERGDRHRPARLAVAVRIDPRRRALLRGRLAALVGVQEVRQRA